MQAQAASPSSSAASSPFRRSASTHVRIRQIEVVYAFQLRLSIFSQGSPPNALLERRGQLIKPKPKLAEACVFHRCREQWEILSAAACAAALRPEESFKHRSMQGRVGQRSSGMSDLCSLFRSVFVTLGSLAQLNTAPACERLRNCIGNIKCGACTQFGEGPQPVPNLWLRTYALQEPRP